MAKFAFSRELPLLLEAEVVVVGGGPAGIAAAISSARAGARTALIERYGFFGGNATAAWVGTICGLYVKRGEDFDYLVGGFPKEFAETLKGRGDAFGPVPFKETAVLLYRPSGFKRLGDELLSDTPRLNAIGHCLVVDALVEEGRVVAAVVGTKKGLRAVAGEVFVDASGEADLTYHAGCPTETAEPGRWQFPSMQFLMENVDMGAAFQAGLETLNTLMATEGQKDPWNLSREGGAVIPTFRQGEVIGAMTRVSLAGRPPDATDPVELTRAEILGRQEAERAAAFLRAHMPGFSEAFLADTPTQLGVRETRWARGEYVLTGEDVTGAARFDDAVARGAWPQEFHTRGKETTYHFLPPGQYYEIPYRSLIVQGARNLLVAGRCFSATHEARASARVIAQAMAMGEAAGIAAALALEKGGEVRKVDVEKLRANLASRGAMP